MTPGDDQTTRTYLDRARHHAREIIVASLLTVVAIGFVVAALIYPSPGVPGESVSLPAEGKLKP